jgi:putative phosphoserine phosphatase/1-acylglycerol-3-phosphate O-acyltransferase
MRTVAFWIRACLGGLGFGLAVLGYTLMLLLPLSDATRRRGFAVLMSRLTCPPLGIRLRIVGGERIGRHHPCVYVLNHQSQVDYPITASIFPANAVVIASQIGDWPVIGAIYRSSGCIVLDRDIPVRAAAALDEATRAVTERNLAIWIFAEGTRGKHPGQLGKFRRGAFRLAATTGVPVVPIVVSPLKPWTDVRGRRLSPHTVTVTVHEPMYAGGVTDADQDALREAVRARMLETLAQHMQPVRTDAA